MLISVKNLTPNSLSTDLGLIGPHELKSAEFAPDLAYKACEGLYALKSAGFITITVSNESDIASEQLIPTTGDYDSRPVNAAIGHQYFDTDNGYPVYWTGSSWTDATVGTDIEWTVQGLNKVTLLVEATTTGKASVNAQYKSIDGTWIEEEVYCLVEIFSTTDGAGASTVVTGTLMKDYYAAGSKTQSLWLKSTDTGSFSLEVTNATPSEWSFIRVSINSNVACAPMTYGV